MEEISLKSLFFYYLERIKTVIILTIIFFVIGIIYTCINRPMYESQSSIMVTGEINTAKSISTSYAEQVTNTKVLESVIDKLNLKMSVNDLKNNITASSETTSNIIFITVKNVNSNNAKKINNEINNQFVEFIKDSYGVSNIATSSEATITSGNIIVDYIKSIIVCTILGIILAIAYIFVKFYFDDSIKSEDEIKDVDIFGVIPNNSNKAYSLVINNITTKTLGIDNKVVLLSSLDDNSNTSRSVFELAKAYSNMDKKVLVLDADLKHNILSKLFDIKSEKGYVDLVSTKSRDITNYIINTKVNNVDLITNGKETLDKVEVLSSSFNETLIKELKDKYDVILINTPPMIGATGTVVLSKYVDINLIVAKHEVSKLKDLNTVIEDYKKEQINIDGIVITNINKKMSDYSKQYFENYYN